MPKWQIVSPIFTRSNLPLGAQFLALLAGRAPGKVNTSRAGPISSCFLLRRVVAAREWPTPVARTSGLPRFARPACSICRIGAKPIDRQRRKTPQAGYLPTMEFSKVLDGLLLLRDD